MCVFVLFVICLLPRLCLFVCLPPRFSQGRLFQRFGYISVFMTAEMRLMRETIDQQYAEIAKLNRNIEALNRQIRKKDETIRNNSLLLIKSQTKSTLLKSKIQASPNDRFGIKKRESMGKSETNTNLA